MNIKDYKIEMEIPEGVNVSVDPETRVVKVSGKEGEVQKKLFHPSIFMKVEKNSVVFDIPKFTKREKKILHTFKAHFMNMFQGVTKKHVYKLKICSGHFPMNVSFGNNELVVKNFFGEKFPRKLKVSTEVDFKLDGQDIVIKSTNVELVGQTAAAVEKLTSRPGFDRRIFQDGIYITEKKGKKVSQ